MAFTPDEVATQEFLTAIRGYDKEEVRRFLSVVARQMADVEDRIAALERQGAATNDGLGPRDEPADDWREPARAEPPHDWKELLAEPAPAPGRGGRGGPRKREDL